MPNVGLAMHLRLGPEHADAIVQRVQDGTSPNQSAAARELMSLGLVLHRAERQGLAVTGEARRLMADDTGMAHVTFGAGLEPEEAGVIAQDVSDAELDAIAEGAPVLMTVEQLAAIAHHRTT